MLNQVAMWLHMQILCVYNFWPNIKFLSEKQIYKVGHRFLIELL